MTNSKGCANVALLYAQRPDNIDTSMSHAQHLDI